MFNAFRILACILIPTLGLAACAMGPREGPPAPVVTISARASLPTRGTPLATEPAPTVAAQAKPLPRSVAPKRKETKVYAYREPGSEPESEPQAAPTAGPELPAAARPQSPAAVAGVPARPLPAASEPASPAAQAPSHSPAAPGTLKAPAQSAPSVKAPPVVAPASSVAVTAPKPPKSASAGLKPVAAGAQAPVGVAAAPVSSPTSAMSARPVAAATAKPSVAAAADPAPPVSHVSRTSSPPASAAPPMPTDRQPPSPTPAKPVTAVAATTPPVARPPASPAPTEPTMVPGLAPAADSLARQAEQQRQTGDYAGAAATLERSLRIAPREAYLWNRLARVRMEQGLTAQAGQLAARSNDCASGQSTVKKDNWRIIAETRRRTGDLAGAGEAERRASGD